MFKSQVLTKKNLHLKMIQCASMVNHTQTINQLSKSKFVSGHKLQHLMPRSSHLDVEVMEVGSTNQDFQKVFFLLADIFGSLLL
jgi:hypothetical protein